MAESNVNIVNIELHSSRQHMFQEYASSCRFHRPQKVTMTRTLTLFATMAYVQTPLKSKGIDSTVSMWQKWYDDAVEELHHVQWVNKK